MHPDLLSLLQERALVVAEIGNNHDGDVEQAKTLIKAAADSGVDAVKFQAHLVEAEMLYDDTVPPHFPEPRWQFMGRMSLTLEQHAEIKAFADEQGVIYFASPFSIEAVDLLEQVGNPFYKIASGEVTNLPMLRHIGRTGKPVLLSSGMSSWAELDAAVDEFKTRGNDLVVMHCTSKYPCPDDRLNLNAIPAMASRYGVPVGFSDHAPTIYPSVAAVALGARIVEKHFTIDKTLYGPDHKASMLPDEMAELVRAVRIVDAGLGDGDKTIPDDLTSTRTVFQKSVVSLVDIPAGAIIEEGMIGTKKPGKGIPANRYFEVIGKTAQRHIPADELVYEEDVE